jgi:glycerophosphoryl diester phosphodiesterase
VWDSRFGAAKPRPSDVARFAHVPLRIGAMTIFDQRIVAGAHERGIRVLVWTVDVPAEMHRLFDVGVDGIITDRPDLLREVLIARGTWTTISKYPETDRRPR